MEIREAGHEKKWEANGEKRKCTRATTTHHLVALGVCAQLGDWAPGRISTRSYASPRGGWPASTVPGAGARTKKNSHFTRSVIHADLDVLSHTAVCWPPGCYSVTR